MERQAMCLNLDCRNITTDYTMLQCSSCGNSLLIIPKKFNNDLFQAIISVVSDYYDLDAILNKSEDGLELYGYTEKRIATIRNWFDFRMFFGDYFYRMYYPIYGGTDSVE